MAQQERIDEYAQKLENQVHQGQMDASSSSSGTPQDLASAKSALDSGEELIARMRQIRATGRVVLAFQPNSTGVESIPPINWRTAIRSLFLQFRMR